MIIDEAHHSHAKSYKKLIHGIEHKLLIGFTATPRKGNLDVFDKIVYSKDIATMIDQGYLSKVIGRKILTGVKLSGVSTSKGDYAIGELSRAIDIESRNKIIVKKFSLHAGMRKKAIAFCATISHAESLTREFKANSIKSEVIHSKLKPDLRSKRLNGLRNGRIKVLTSVGILTEGFDLPEIDTIIMARPTQIKGFYIQMAGRGLRIAKNKTDCLIMDFNDEDHSLKQVISLKAITGKETIADPLKYDPKPGDTCDLPEKQTGVVKLDKQYDPLLDQDEYPQDNTVEIVTPEKHSQPLSPEYVFIINELKKYNLDPFNFEQELKYNWQYKIINTSVTSLPIKPEEQYLKATLDSFTSVTIQDKKLTFKINGEETSHQIPEFFTCDLKQLLINVIRDLEKETIEVSCYKELSFIANGSHLKCSTKQKEFLNALLETKEHFVDINPRTCRVSRTVASVAIDHLLSCPEKKKVKKKEIKLTPIEIIKEQTAIAYADTEDIDRINILLEIQGLLKQLN